ncbi:MAG TPA: VWA domain-containing protein, partial [Pyrinomonadaceae bacterium]|nr:VWA domain-containing protein [Pyrinomonadaceae bacterium]
VTFSDKQTVVSPLESDKEKLFDSVSKIKDFGGSWVWDAEKFALDMLKRDSTADRRKAIVVMTDGVDNALTYDPGAGSKTLFADLIEEVRNNSTAIFPIYLNTQGPGELNAQMYADARRTLQLLADESGGNYYTTKDVGKLSEVYERVLRDVGRVYSLGYEPANAKRDGSWRTIRVEIPGHPDIKVRARPGYYAK